MKKTLTVVLAAMMVASLTACGGSVAKDTIVAVVKVSAVESTAEETGEGVGTNETEKAAGTGEKKQYKFGFTEMSAGSFFGVCYSGAEEVVKANGDEIVRVEDKADSAYQPGVIEDFISQGCGLVFYNPPDVVALAVAVKALDDAGIPIVNFDSAVSDLSKVNCFVVSDSYSCGQIAGEELIKNHLEGGEAAALDFPASAVATDRAKGFVDTATADGLLEVVAQMDAGAKPEKGLTVMQDLLQAHSDSTAVFCINDERAQGAYPAITTAGNKTEIYSVNAGSETKAAVIKDGADGIWKCTAAQGPIGIGRKSAKVTYKILNGGSYESEIKIPSFAVIPENIDQYSKSDWQQVRWRPLMLDWRERDSTVWARSILRSASGQPPSIIQHEESGVLTVSTVLEMKHIAKSFSGNKVLLDVDLTVGEGEVHTLLGGNSAGKSIPMKILGGIYTKGAGSILINGREAQIYNVADARDNGISIIHQELMLARRTTIARNVFMGGEQKKTGGFVDLARQEVEIQRFLDHYGIKLKTDTRLDRSTIAQRQMVEITRAVPSGSRIVVTDEPASSSPDAEVDTLYEMIRILKEQKVSVIYISYRLSGLHDTVDRTTVLRDGKRVGTTRMKGTERVELIAMVIGRDLASYYTKNDNTKDKVVLEVKELSDSKMVKKVSFDPRKGEIPGVSGLVRAGRSEAVECLFGIRRKARGTARFKGREVDFRNPREAVANGFGMVPESRKEQGLFLQSGVWFNTTTNVAPRFLKHLIWNRQTEEGIAEGKINDMRVRVTRLEQVAGKLSGGNQQKVLIGRWLCSTQSVPILNEPTRGVDVKTKSEIYALTDQLAASGMSIIMVPSELPEIINTSDKVLAMCNGYSTGILNRGELTQEWIMTPATTEVDA